MLPIANKLLHLYNYEGIFFFIAIFSGLVYFSILAKEENFDLDILYEGLFISLLSALLMGRLFSLVFWEPARFFSQPWIFFIVWQYSGISVTGGVIGGLVAGYIFLKIKKLHFFHHVKFFIPGIVLGQIIGRFGCFLNGDASGKPTEMPWGIVYNSQSAAYSSSIMKDTPLHPTQLYEILGNLILFVLLISLGNNKWITNRRIIWYALFYGILRFIIEFFRSDTMQVYFLTSGQIISIAGFITGAALLIWSIFNDDKMTAKKENIAYAKPADAKDVKNKIK
jgi:phosphatidylglycerol:prolipoprotein diacylglycerol transferase